MKTLICLLFSLFMFGLAHAESACLRIALEHCLDVEPAEKLLDYPAWYAAFTATEDEDMQDLLVTTYHSHLFDACIPTPEALETYLQMFPENDEVLNSVAWTYYQMGIKTERAYDLVRRIKTHSAASLDTLAMLKMRRGFPAEALQLFLDLLPNIPSPLNTKYETDSEENLIGRAEMLIHTMQAMILYDHAGDVFYKNAYLPEAAALWRLSQKFAEFIETEYQIAPLSLTNGDFDPQRIKQKNKAIRLTLKKMMNRE